MLINEKKNFLLLSFFDDINRLKCNLDVISNKLKRSPLSHLRILLRFTKGFHRMVKSSIGGISFLEMMVETFHEHHGSFVIYWPQDHQHRTSTSCKEGTSYTDHTLTFRILPSGYCLVHCDCNLRPQDELEDWPPVRRIFSKCSPFLEGTWKSIQGLGTGQFL